MPGLTTLYQIRRIYRFFSIRCDACPRGGTLSVHEAIGIHGAQARPKDVARQLFADCPGLPKYLDNGVCRWSYSFSGPLKLSEGPEELHLVCGSPTINRVKKCKRRRHVDVMRLIRRTGDITIAEFLRRSTCRICRHKGAELE